MRGCLEVPTAPLSCRPHAECQSLETGWSSEIQSTMTKAGVVCYLRQPHIETTAQRVRDESKDVMEEGESSVPAHSDHQQEVRIRILTSNWNEAKKTLSDRGPTALRFPSPVRVSTFREGGEKGAVESQVRILLQPIRRVSFLYGCFSLEHEPAVLRLRSHQLHGDGRHQVRI